MRLFTMPLTALPLMLLPLTALSLTLAPPSASAMVMEAVPEVMQKTVDGFIRPGYRHFLDNAEKLTVAMQALCAAPSAQAQDTAKAAFDEAVRAWSTIEIVRIGPVLDQNRFERILFYPDRKATGMKQVQGMLAKPDEKDTVVANLANKSVAMQGFGALEFVLSGSGAETLADASGNFRCRYGAAIAGNVQNVAADLVAAWDAPNGVADAWKHPGFDNPVYRDGKEAITALLGILVHGTETVRDQRIETFYKGENQPMFPKQALFWRSGNTWDTVQGNLEGLKLLIAISDMGALLDPESRFVIGYLDTALDALIAKTGELNPDIEAAVASPEQRQKLDFMLTRTKDLIFRLNEEYGGSIGLGAGFSFADGD